MADENLRARSNLLAETLLGVHLPRHRVGSLAITY